MIGNAIEKASPHAFNQIMMMLVTKPALNALTQKDMIPDIINAIKSENMYY